MTGIEEVATLAPAARFARNLVLGGKRRNEDRKKKKSCARCLRCIRGHDKEEEYSQKQEDSVVEYKDKSVKLNVLCCSTNSDARHVGLDLDLDWLARIESPSAREPRSQICRETSV